MDLDSIQKNTIEDIMLKICSGCQSGADEGGLIAAKAAGLETGGWIPNGFITENGPRPEFVELYGIQEHPSEGYVGRTYANARDSDGTIRFATNFRSRGEIVTLEACNKYNKPHIDVDFCFNDATSPSDVVQWIKQNNIKVLNVAGNRESVSPGICQKVQNFLGEVFKLLNG